MIPALATLDGETANPMLPALYDLAYLIVLIIVVALIVVSLVSIARHRDGSSSWATAVWSAVVVFAPLLGLIAWFVVGRPAARAAQLTPAARGR
ncbi:PLDc N-terminal domain-containing protein [Microcella daejeonensis]|uniref:PLDc N-terminal domain-containing protein n=1 Tax=Microcella daejeonensis TaxID=2994971 RepID=UPI00226FD347|nr:PLDc N-terminal domain-containing protein [Microcella daejeonensis]WAB83484.1 PLDc N-terminal domain-containing protein [Microcella daejeonensis]